jgi:polysaccharide biosynthesis transport protein
MGDTTSGQLPSRELARPGNLRAISPAGEYIPHGNYPANDREQSKFGTIGDRLIRRWRLIAAVFLGVAGAGAGLAMLQTPRYSATALIMIDPAPDQMATGKQAANARSDAAIVDSQIEVLKSPVMAARLADELGLHKDPEWGADADPKLASSQSVASEKVAVGPTTATPAVVATIVNPLGTDDPAVETAEAVNTSLVTAAHVPDRVVSAVGGALDIRRRGLSYVVEVTAQSQSADQAAQMANGLSGIYLKSLAEARYDASEKGNAWLKDRLGELKIEVERKQAAAQAYRAQKNLLTAQGASLVEQQVAVLQTSLLQTRAEYAQKNSEYRSLNDIADSGRTVATFNSPNDAMRDLRVKETDLAQRIAELGTRYGPAHPDVLKATEEKASIDRRIKEEMERTTAKAKVEADSLSARLDVQQAELAALRGGLVTESFDQVRLDALQTDAEAAQSVYESFLQRYHEVASQGVATGVGARLLSPALSPPSPTSPSLLLNFTLIAFAAMLIALLAGLVAEHFRGAVETTDEVEQRVGVRALVGIPALRRKHLRNMPKRNQTPTSYLLAKRLSPFAESFRVLLTAIQLADSPNRKVVAITSAMPGEGKTTLSLGLARVAAIGGQKVIVIDCDLRMRALNNLLEIDPQGGLQEVLAGTKTWRDIVGKDEASGAHVLPASAMTSKDFFGTGAMEQLIRELEMEYDLVVLDCPPVFAVADARVVASLADSVVIAARSGKTSARAIQAAVEQLELAGANVLGVALNRIDIRRTRGSFYDGLYYSKAFSGYYAREA